LVSPVRRKVRTTWLDTPAKGRLVRLFGRGTVIAALPIVHIRDFYL